MAERYAKNYHILGVRPGVSWKELRKAYKSLVNTWHPDHFQQDVRQHKLAEEKTKEITKSYKELADYYKEFGSLPHVNKKTDIPAAEDSALQDEPDARPASERQDRDHPDTDVTPARAHKRWLSKRPIRAMVAAALAGAAYFVWQSVPWERSDYLPQDKNRSEKMADTQKNENSNHRDLDVEKFFTTGTQLGEVYAIQGVPTKTEKDVWYYGNSKIYFVNGKVLRWEESPDHPLRVRIIAEMGGVRAEFFGKGSSKEEVLAIQGAPDRDAGSVWDYGASRVYFSNNRVTGWHEIPLNPLKVRQ